jgi:hypothetical protein
MTWATAHFGGNGHQHVHMLEVEMALSAGPVPEHRAEVFAELPHRAFRRYFGIQTTW